MSQHDIIVERLKELGWRLTPQRLMILRAIGNGSRHMGVDEIYCQVQEVYPYMDITTVYRTVHLMKKLGLVTEVVLGGRLHYELTLPNDRHHHMVCGKCSGTFDLSPHYLEEFREALVEKFGFEPDLDNFTVRGVCAQCGSANGGKGPH